MLLGLNLVPALILVASGGDHPGLDEPPVDYAEYASTDPAAAQRLRRRAGADPVLPRPAVRLDRALPRPADARVDLRADAAGLADGGTCCVFLRHPRSLLLYVGALLAGPTSTEQTAEALPGGAGRTCCWRACSPASTGVISSLLHAAAGSPWSPASRCCCSGTAWSRPSRASRSTEDAEPGRRVRRPALAVHALPRGRWSPLDAPIEARSPRRPARRMEAALPRGEPRCRSWSAHRPAAAALPEGGVPDEPCSS